MLGSSKVKTDNGVLRHGATENSIALGGSGCNKFPKYKFLPRGVDDPIVVEPFVKTDRLADIVVKLGDLFEKSPVFGEKRQKTTAVVVKVSITELYEHVLTIGRKATAQKPRQSSIVPVNWEMNKFACFQIETNERVVSCGSVQHAVVLRRKIGDAKRGIGEVG